MTQPVNQEIDLQVRLVWTGETPPAGINDIGFDLDHPFAPLERYFLLERDGDLEAPVEVQWEDSHHAAVESWLLPNLRATAPYPERSKQTVVKAPPRVVFPGDWPAKDPWEGAVEGHLQDPESPLPPYLLALAKTPEGDLHRFVIGVAYWSQDRSVSHRELWQELEEEHKGIQVGWLKLIEMLTDKTR